MTEHTPPTDPSPAGLPAPRRPRRWLTVLLMLIVFGSGLAIGSGATFMYIEYRRAYYQQHPEDLPRRFAQRLRKQLKLSADQTDEVQAIVERYWPQFQEIRRTTMEPLFRALHADVAEVLSDDQRPRWDEFMNRIYRTWGSTQPASAPAEAATAPATGPS